MQAIRSGRLTPIAQAAPWTPAPLAEAITWALATRREQRATAAQFAHALEAFIKSSPEIATPMQLGGWLRARFPPEPTDQAATPAFAIAADASNAGARLAGENDTGFEATDPPAELPVYASAAPEPAEPPPSTIALEHGETRMRSGAYRLPVPSGPAAVPTLLEAPPPPPSAPAAVPALLEARPIAPLRASPVTEVPAMPGQVAPRSTAMTPAVRTAVLALGLCGLALLSFAIVLAARSPHPSTTGHAALHVARDAPLAIDAASDAALDAPAPPDAAPDAPIDALTTARLDVHTDPAGATVAIYPCPGREREPCGRVRSDGAAQVDGCTAAPCSFRLPVGSYEIVVEQGGASEARPVAVNGDMTTSLDIVLKAASRARASTGKLTVHTRQRCEAIVDARRRLPTPIVELELRPGPHKLELTCGRRSLTRSVTIAPGKTTDLTVAPR